MSGQTHAPVCRWGSVVQSAPSPGLSTGCGEGGEAAGDLAADLCLTQGVRSPRGRETLETWSLRTGLCFCPCVLLRRPEQTPVACECSWCVREQTGGSQDARGRRGIPAKPARPGLRVVWGLPWVLVLARRFSVPASFHPYQTPLISEPSTCPLDSPFNVLTPCTIHGERRSPPTEQ